MNICQQKFENVWIIFINLPDISTTTVICHAMLNFLKIILKRIASLPFDQKPAQDEMVTWFNEDGRRRPIWFLLPCCQQKSVV